MTISVLIAVYNAEETIKEAIESILTQTYQDFEIIIVDDGSTDNTIKIIESLNDVRISIYMNSENLGQIKSLNLGIMYCQGEFIARMDADDISLPFRFEVQMKEFKKDPELVLIGTSGYKTLQSGEIKKLTAFPRNTDALRFFSMYRNPINHISVMIRKDFLKAPNIYNEEFLISTDWELWSRFFINGVKTKILKKRCIIYLVSDSSYSERNSNIKESENIKIVKENVLHYTGVILNDSQAKDIISFHYIKDFYLTDFKRRWLLWHRITKKYKYINRYHYYYIYTYDLTLVILKHFRYLIHKIIYKKC